MQVRFVARRNETCRASAWSSHHLRVSHFAVRENQFAEKIMGILIWQLLYRLFQSPGQVSRKRPPVLADEPIVLWPDGAPGAVGKEPGDIPTLTPYFPPAEKANGAAIIVCPGGGYSHLADHEGRPVAEWLNTLGITALCAEIPAGPSLSSSRAFAGRGARDSHRAGACNGMASRSRAHWHSRILSRRPPATATIGTHFDAGKADAPDPIDRLSSRPDLMVLIYPVITMKEFTHAGSKKMLLGENPTPELITLLSNDEQVTKETPPAFLVHTADDPGVPVENSLRFAAALRKARVPVEIHIYEHGPHGFGLGTKDPILATWPQRCAEWLRLHGFIKA